VPGENSGSGNSKVTVSKTTNANVRENRIPSNVATTPAFKPEIIKPAPAPSTRPGPAYKPEIINPIVVSKPTFQNTSPPSFENVSVPPTPPTPTTTVVVTPPPPPIKTATPDIVLFDEEAIDVDQMFDLIFENLSGQELISITRSDIINGQKISYQPIKNLSNIQQRYNPNNIISLQQTADRYFAGFSIKLEDRIPNDGNGQNGENIYIDSVTGDLVIEFINLNNDEQIETEITLNGTIYEINLGEITS
jgi:hypothetical protein